MMVKDRSSNWLWAPFSLNFILKFILKFMLPNFVVVFLVACGGTDNSSLYSADLPSALVSPQVSEDNRSANIPSNPGADQGAIELLSYLHELTGKQVLSGQGQLLWDNEFSPHVPSSREKYVYDQIGKYPAIYTTDRAK